MIKVFRTFDSYLVEAMMGLPEVWKEVKDDSCPKNPGVVDIPFLMKECVCLGVKDDDDAVGVFLFVPKGPTTCEAHTMLASRCHGAKAVQAGKQAIAWIWQNTANTEITSFAWSDRPHVAWYMSVLGLKRTSEEDWPNTRDGKPIKIFRYSISKTT